MSKFKYIDSYYSNKNEDVINFLVNDGIIESLDGSVPSQSEKFLLEEDKQCSERGKDSHYKLASELYQIEGICI